MRNFRLICFIAALAVLSSCEQKPLYPKTQKKTSETEKSDNTGIADAADYATGALPLKVLKQTEKKVDNMQKTREKQIENLKKD